MLTGSGSESESVGSTGLWLPGSRSESEKYADPRIRIQGVKYQPKTAKNNIFLSQNPNLHYEKQVLDF